MSETRTVLDTNVVVSAALFEHSVPMKALVAATRGKVLLSDATANELEKVLRRPRFDKYVSLTVRMTFLSNLFALAERIEVTEVIAECRDAKDNMFLELAVSGRASHLLTGDDDLLALHPFRGISIVTPQQFLDAMPV